jgi:hypothetical protein
MLRVIFPLVSLLIAGFSIGTDLFPQRPDSQVCVHGGCRIDQTDAIVVAEGATPAAAKALLVQDSADPAMWCAYGEFLTTSGDSQPAQVAFARALALGPGVSPVLMRVANFDFTHGRVAEGLRLAPRILSQTENFDDLVFSYVRASHVAAPQLLGSVIPATPRVARSWLQWQRRLGADQDVLDTWTWMRQNGLTDERSAVDTAITLWQRKAYRAAEELWAGWLDARRGDYLNPQLLANRRFEDAPSGTPFDWNLAPNPSVEFTRRDGLEIHFLGQENLTAVGVQQFTAVQPGRYRFAAEIQSDDLTTDQGPFFQIDDLENSGRLSVVAPPILGTRSRSWISADFTVPAGTRVLQIQLARRPSLKFENKIAGTLHIYRVSLLPAPH